MATAAPLTRCLARLPSERLSAAMACDCGSLRRVRQTWSEQRREVQACMHRQPALHRASACGRDAVPLDGDVLVYV